MIDILGSEAMAACDRRAIERFGIPGLVLMENAGLQTVECLLETFGAPPPEVLVICGKGNNGGDGLVIARHLAHAGSEVQLVLLASAGDLRGDTAANLAMVRELGLPLIEIADPEAWNEHAPDPDAYDLVIDAILGTGLREAARGVAASAIEALAASAVAIVSVDLPSGLAADSGTPPGPAVQATLTVTFAAPKPCHVLTPAADRCGELAVVDISIPPAALAEAEPTLRMPTREDWAGIRPRRASTEHKGDQGRVLVVAGAVGTTGAAVLTARGALRAGAGLVHVASPDGVWPVVAGHLVEALVHPIGAGNRHLRLDDLDELLELAAGVDVVALGPGLGTAGETVALVRRMAVELELPMVIDADGLNALVGELAALRSAAGPRILTPHPGEAARLLELGVAEVQADRPAALERLVEMSGALVVLKGSRTLSGAPGACPIVNPTGNPGLASGGTGDVLTGVVAALVAQGLEPLEAAWGGAWVHGQAADLAALRLGEVGLLAGDVAEALPLAIGGDDGDEDRPDA